MRGDGMVQPTNCVHVELRIQCASKDQGHMIDGGRCIDSPIRRESHRFCQDCNYHCYGASKLLNLELLGPIFDGTAKANSCKSKNMVFLRLRDGENGESRCGGSIARSWYSVSVLSDAWD